MDLSLERSKGGKIQTGGERAGKDSPEGGENERAS